MVDRLVWASVFFTAPFLLCCPVTSVVPGSLFFGHSIRIFNLSSPIITACIPFLCVDRVMAKLSAGQKRRQKELKRKKKKQVQVKKQQGYSVREGNPSGLPKLSERVIELADVLLKETDGSRGAIENTIGLMVMCWNIGTVNAEKADEMRATMAQMLCDLGTKDIDDEFESLLDVVITQRRCLYADDPRLIGEFQVNWDSFGDYRLQVMSLLLPEEDRFVLSSDTLSSGLSAMSKRKAEYLDNPVTEHEEQLENLIARGNDILNDGASVDGVNSSVMACEVWLEAWDMIKQLYIDETSIDQINNRLSVALGFWCDDIDMHLSNAARVDASFIERGIAFCREFCDFFPNDQPATHVNMRRTLAELQLMKGDVEQAEATFDALVKDLPDEGWGYIGWGDIYNPVYSSTSPVPADIDRAKQLYRTPILKELDSAGDARERLEELIAFEREAATTMDA